MKKIIKKFWGVGLILILLSTLFVGAVPQAAAGNFALTDTFATPGNVVVPTTVVSPAAGFGILDVAQSGSTIYATGAAGAVEYLYKSIDGGVTWVQTARGAVGFNRGLPDDAFLLGGTSRWGLVAVAPDDPNIVVVVNTDNVAVGDTVFLSTTGGTIFQELPGITSNITCIAISPQMGPFRYIAVGGSQNGSTPASNLGYLRQWTVGATVTGWAAPTNFANLGVDGVHALAYSTNFLADQCLLVVTEDTGLAGSTVAIDANGAIGLHVYRYDIADWDQNVDATFPRYLERTTASDLRMGSADIVLDANFYMGDEASQIGFIGANITDNATVNTQYGGVYRVGTYTLVAGNNTITQIDTGVAINSVAWDGTNLMAAVQANSPTGLVVRRSSSATSAFPTFLTNTGVKTPGTGNATIVLFNASAGVGYAFSRGANSAICRTTDYGKSFNGFALVNSLLANIGFGNFNDMWTSADAATKYFTVADGVDLNLWRQSGFTWERVLIIAGGTAQNWTVSADADNPANVYIARVGATTIWKSTDSGNTIWQIRTSPNNIQDIVVQDADTIYVAAQGTAFVRKATGTFTTWALPMTVPFAAGGGNVYSLNLLADDQLLVGGTTAGVAYTADGGTNWTGLPNLTWAGGNVVTAATGLGTGDSIFAVGNGGAAVCRWVIGTNFIWDLGTATAGGLVNGIALTNGVLYVLDPALAGGTLLRCLHPTTVSFTLGALGWEGYAAVGATYTRGINTLHATAAGTTSTVWSIDQAVFDPVNNFIDYLTSPSNAPIPVYPLAGTSISINSINGAVAAFVFKWDSPPVFVFPGPQLYDYNLQVYLDEAGLVPICGSATVAVLVGAVTAPNLSVASTAATVGFGAVAVPGETYYWRVRVDMVTPAESYWSAMQTFTVEQLVAVVPIIGSPENGASIDSTTPAFSWSPIAGATSYTFELYDTADVATATPIYTTTTTTAGAEVPSDLALTRGDQYFWRVKTLTPAEGEWSTLANFIVAELPPTTEPPIVTIPPSTSIIVTIPPDSTTITTVVIPPAEEKVVNPTYIWAIIIIGAILVIAVIVLIVRTRRSV